MSAPTESGNPCGPARSDGDRGSWWKGPVCLAAVIVLLVLVRHLALPDPIRQALDWAGEKSPWRAPLFVGLYVVATVALVPGSVLTLGAGALFGVVAGSVYVSIGSTLGATCSFLLGRYVARAAVARRIADNPRFAALDAAVEREGWKIVGLTRLSPVFPFTLLNYAFGLTRVKVGHYVLASWIGMMPGTVMYVYLGSLARAFSGERTRGPGEWILYGVGLVATVVVAVLVSRLARKTLGGGLGSD